MEASATCGMRGEAVTAIAIAALGIFGIWWYRSEWKRAEEILEETQCYVTELRMERGKKHGGFNL